MKLSSPWIKFVREVEALFGEDPDIRVEYQDPGKLLRLYVDNQKKAEALGRLMPASKKFGNIELMIEVFPANTETIPTPWNDMNEAFCGNPALCYMWDSDTPMGSFHYAVFKNKVVQFFNDDMGDINGNCTTLYQEIAKNIFGDSVEGIFFCTAADSKNLQKPLGEWP